ncbi:MAG: hypothetical protein EBY81_07160, partial [Verrucomicrobia bacterium]|nr:hypothetical protein [Verrucomicrobiota bacterium]
NNFVETAQKGVKLSGYVDAGYSYNFTGSQGANSDVTGRFGSDTASRGDFNLYAVKLALEKALTSENKAQAGFRTDVMIGEDANYLINRGVTNNLSNNTQNSNALFLEQAYVSIRAPVGNGWDFKVGKFVSILGYEVIERPANMNVTYGLLWQQMPLYYTGVLSSYKFDDYLDGKLGVVNGSNSDNNTTTDPNVSDGVALLAALNVTAPGGNANWSNNFQYSTANDNNTSVSEGESSMFPSSKDVRTAGNDSKATAYTVIYNTWGNWVPKFANDKLLVAFNALLGNTSGNLSTTSQNANVNSCWYGAGAYAKYQFNDWFSLCSRGEYLGSNNSWAFGNQGAPVTARSPNGNHVTGDNLWEYTLTAGFNVIDNLLIRAEYRMDWGSNIYSTATGNPNGAQSGGPAYYAGAEVVYSF